MNNELKQIKKKYGERMMKLCRSLFPTILNEEGKLIEILDSTFGHPKYLYDDIMEKKAIDRFKNFIYSKYENEKEENNRTDKTPFQLMKEVGYTLYECKSEEDIMKFRKYYTEDEELCTFKWGNRLNTNYVFFAVKNNVDDIKRKNFKSPQRQDEYGTSVISIQFSRGDVNTLSIKNRYNHTVSNPDATFDNNLDNIISGLTDSFEEYYGFNINHNEIGKLGLNYVKATDGKYYKCNMEINNAYYCPDNIIIDNGEVIKDFIDKEKYLVIDNFILNLQNNNINSIYNGKSITQYGSGIMRDCFPNDLQKFDKINIIKNDDGTKTIELIKKDKYPVYIKIDKCNNIIGYTNSNLKEIRNNFLMWNRKLKELDIKNVKEIGDDFLATNDKLLSLNLPNTIVIGNRFLANCANLKTIELEKVKEIRHHFLGWNIDLEYLYAPNLEKISNGFLEYNVALKSLSLPKVKEVGERFIENNRDLSYLDIPNIEKAGKFFMNRNIALTIIDFPKLELLENGFFQKNESLGKINLPNAIAIADDCLTCANVEELSLPKVSYIGEAFMEENSKLKSIFIPELISVGDYFLYCNTELEKISFPKLKIIGNCFINNNFIINSVYLPLCESVGRNFLHDNLELTDLSLPKVKTIGIEFLPDNNKLRNLFLEEVQEIKFNFLIHNNSLKKLSCPKLFYIEENFLAYNRVLEEIYVPCLNFCNIPQDFYDNYGKLAGLTNNKTKKLVR